MATDHDPAGESTQLLGDRATGAALLTTTAAVGYGLWRVTGWDLTVWWRALALLVGAYLLAAIAMLGLNAFVRKAHAEYQRLTP